MTTLALSLRPLTDIQGEDYLFLLALFEQEYTSIGDCDTAEEGYQYFLSKTVSWAIMDSEIPVGLIALSPSPRHGAYYQTTTYIFPGHRGKSYNPIIKTIFAQAFLRTPEIKLCSVVRDWNERSQKSLTKTFPTITPIKELRTEQQKHKDPTAHQWFYDLSQTPYREPYPEEVSILGTVETWLKENQKTLATGTVLALN